MAIQLTQKNTVVKGLLPTLDRFFFLVRSAKGLNGILIAADDCGRLITLVKVVTFIQQNVTIKQPKKIDSCATNTTKIRIILNNPAPPPPPMLIITLIIHSKVRATTTIKRTAEAIVEFQLLMTMVAAADVADEDADALSAAAAAVDVVAVAVAVVQRPPPRPLNLTTQSFTTKMTSRSKRSLITTR